MLVVERVRKMMETKNINQKELAQLSHITEASLSKYLSGTREPRNDVIFNLAKALGTTTDYLLGFDEKFERPFEQSCELLTRTKEQLTDDQKRTLINILLEK